MVQDIYNICNIFAHVTADIIWFCQQLRCLVHQVCRNHPVNNAVFHSLIKFFQSVCKQPEGRNDKNTLCLAFFQLGCDINHAVARRNHVIDDHDVFVFHGSPEEFVGNNRITPVYNAAVIAALVKHADINAENAGQVYGTAGSAFVRAYHHHMVGIEFQIRHIAAQSLDKLVRRLDGFESGQRYRILLARVMGVKRNDIFHAHIGQLLQHHRAVHGLAAVAPVLAPFI